MATAKQLVVTYGVDSSPLKKATKEIEDAHTSMGSKVSAVGNEMSGVFGKLGNSFGINLGPVKGIAAETGGAMEGLGKTGLGMAGAFGIAGGAAVGIVAAFKSAADTTATVAGEIRKLQAITGSSAEDASRLRHEFVHFGVDADAGGTALVKFSKNLEEGSAKFKQWFTEADLARMKGKDLTQDIPLLAAKYQSLGTAVEKNTFLIDAFGKGGTALRPILSANVDDLARVGKEADKLGLTFSQKGLADAKAYTIAQRDLGETLKGVEVTLGRAVIPTLTTFLQDVSKGIGVIGQFNEKLKGMTAGSFGLGDAVKAVMGIYSPAMNAAGMATDAARLSVEAENQSLKDNAAEADKAAKAQESYAAGIVASFNPLGNAISAIGSLSKSTASAAKSSDQYAYDLQKLNELQKDGVINTKALDAAVKGIESTARATEAADVARLKAVDNVTSAMKKEADAARALQTLLGGPSPTDQAKAEEDIGKAKDNSTRASLSLQDAIAAENVLKASGTATARQLLDASLAVNAARYGEMDAAKAEADAVKVLYDLQHAADVGSVQRVTLEDNLKAAHDGVTDALRAEVDQTRALRDAQLAQADAVKALQVAQAPDEGLLKGIADAQRTLAKDTQATGGALSGLASTTAISFAQIKEQLLKQITDTMNWASNLKFLVEHGVSEAILKPLADMKEKAGPALQAIRDEVVAHGVGTINDLGTGITNAENAVNAALAAEHDGIQSFYLAHPLVVAADLRFSKAQIAAFEAFSGTSIQRAGGLQAFDSGGIVQGPYGSPQVILAHAGEEVRPLGGTSSSGGNVYVTVNVGGNVTADHAIADTVYDRLLELKHRQGTLGLS